MQKKNLMCKLCKKKETVFKDYNNLTKRGWKQISIDIFLCPDCLKENSNFNFDYCQILVDSDYECLQDLINKFMLLGYKVHGNIISLQRGEEGTITYELLQIMLRDGKKERIM